MRAFATGARDRRRMAQALRVGEPIHLQLRAVPPLDALAQLLPLCASLSVGGRGGATSPELRPLGPARPAPVPPVGVTAVIPSHRRWPDGLGALLRQSLRPEVLVLGNKGGPKRVAGARVLSVPWLGHGRTRQAALAQVTTPFVLFMSDDARPLGAGWLATLVRALLDGPWDAVVARQVPWPDAPAAVRQRVSRWTPFSPGITPFPQADHVATLHRTATLGAFPLPPVATAEDLVWSRGRRVGLVGAAPVLHSHPPRVRARFRRTVAEHQVRRAAGLETPGASVVGLATGLAATVPRALRSGTRVALADSAELLGQWLGARRGAAHEIAPDETRGAAPPSRPSRDSDPG